MFVLFYLILVASLGSAENVQNKMYVQLESVSPCVLRLNGSQSFGCTSDRSGNVGAVHIVDDDTSLNWVLNTPAVNAYIVVISLKLFTLENLTKLNSKDHVKGVFVVLKNKQSISNFSPESKCPNQYSGVAQLKKKDPVCDVKNPWNPIGNSISMQKWNIPIFFTDDNETIRTVEECFNKFNVPLETQNNRALCALELSSHMLAAVDSATCLRRINYFDPSSYCDVLGNKNIYAPGVPFNKFNKMGNESYIFVTARLDATSLFYGRAPGALSVVTSLVALLLTSKLLNEMLLENTTNLKKNVLFIAFNGEAYDYIGSSRIVFDMERGKFPFDEEPLKLDDISMFIELSQLGAAGVPVFYHLYEDNESDKNGNVNKFIDKMKREGKDFNINPSRINDRDQFPPSSYQSFLARKNLPGFVFASYNANFQNEYYHSLYDDFENINYEFMNGSSVPENTIQAFIANFSTVLARSLFEEMTGEETSTSSKNSYENADQILQCLAYNVNCKIFSDLGIDTSSSPGLDYYVGISKQRTFMTESTKILFEFLTSRNVSAADQDECQSKKTPGYRNVWIQSRKQCIETTVNVSEAVSPAFVLPEYQLSSGVYSSWTESSWRVSSMRIFLKPSAKYEWSVFVIGIFVFVSSFFTLYWINRNAREVFNYPHLISPSSI